MGFKFSGYLASDQNPVSAIFVDKEYFGVSLCVFSLFILSLSPYFNEKKKKQTCKLCLADKYTSLNDVFSFSSSFFMLPGKHI